MPCIFITIICYEEHIFISCTTNCTMAAVNYNFCQNEGGGGGFGVVAGTLQAPLSNIICRPIIVILQEKEVASPS